MTMKGFWEQMMPPGFTGQMELMGRVLQQLVEDVAAIRQAVTTVPDVEAQPEPFYQALPYTTPNKMDVVALVCAGDTPGVYSVKVGTYTAFSIPLSGLVPIMLDLSGLKRLTVNRGTTISVTPPAGGTAYFTAVALAS